MKTSHPQDVCYRKRGKVSRHVVQTIFGEATKLPHCHRQASFKHLVQENPNGKEHHKHNHGKHVKRVHRLRICVQRRISSTIVHKCKKTVVKKLKSSSIPKREIKNITGPASADGLDDYDSGDQREQQIEPMTTVVAFLQEVPVSCKFDCICLLPAMFTIPLTAASP